LDSLLPKDKNITEKILTLYSIRNDIRVAFYNEKHVEVKPYFDLKKMRLLRMYYQQEVLKKQLSQAKSMVMKGNRLKNARDYTTGKGTSFEYTTDNSAARTEGEELFEKGTKIINEYNEVSELITKLIHEVIEGNEPVKLTSNNGISVLCIVLEVSGNEVIGINCKNSKIFTANIDLHLDSKTKKMLKENNY
jgi:hypothetical protein